MLREGTLAAEAGAESDMGLADIGDDHLSIELNSLLAMLDDNPDSSVRIPPLLFSTSSNKELNRSSLGRLGIAGMGKCHSRNLVIYFCSVA